MLVQIKSLTGKTFTVEADPKDTIAHVKALIHAQTGTPPDCQRLIFAGRERDNASTLMDCNITKDSVIHLCVKAIKVVTVDSALLYLQECNIAPDDVTAMSDADYKEFAESLEWPRHIALAVRAHCRRTSGPVPAAAPGEMFRLQRKFERMRMTGAQLIRERFMSLAVSGTVQVCFVVDGTGSMRKIINAVKTNIVRISRSFCEATNALPKFALVVYRDYDDKNHIEKFDFTTADGLETVLDSVQVTGGDDDCEDCFGGLNEAMTKLKWSAPVRILIWIGDAPQHGVRYNGGCKDDHPNDKRITGVELAKLSSKNGIATHFLKLFATTDVMIAALQEDFGSVGVGLACTTMEDLGKAPDTITDVLVSETLSTVARAEGEHDEGANGSLKEIPINPDAIVDRPEQQVQVFTAATVANVPNVNPLGYLLMTFPPCAQEHITMCLSSEPFAKGRLRYAFRCELKVKSRFHPSWYEGRVVHVAKTPIRRSNRMSLTLVQIQQVARFLALEFTARLREKCPKAPALMYIPVQMVQFDTMWMLEPFIEGEFLKFNTNMGGVTQKLLPSHPLPQAFSHFTFDFSGGGLVVCDIQGVFKPPAKDTPHGAYVLTDPAIHTVESNKVLPDVTNHGEKGISCFFKTHKCNEYCRLLNLRERNDEADFAADSMTEMNSIADHTDMG